MGQVDDKRRARRRLIEAFGPACWYCGIDLSYRENHIDHIVPLSAGGVNALENLALACTCCNYAKSGRPLDEFYAWMRWVSGKEFAPKILPGEPHPMSKNYGPTLPGCS